jgi:hypothetical protein
MVFLTPVPEGEAVNLSRPGSLGIWRPLRGKRCPEWSKVCFHFLLVCDLNIVWLGIRMCCSTPTL